MKKKLYESPYSESYRLYSESPILSGSSFGGGKLEYLDDEEFGNEENFARGTWFD